MSKESWAPNKRATALTVLSLPGRARIIRETVCEGVHVENVAGKMSALTKISIRQDASIP